MDGIPLSNNIKSALQTRKNFEFATEFEDFRALCWAALRSSTYLVDFVFL